MSYTVDTANTKIVQTASTTDTDLSGLTGLLDSSGNPVVLTQGGTLSGGTGAQKVYTIVEPYRFEIAGTQTINPEDEMLFLENTTEVDGSNDLMVISGGTLTIAGKFVETWGGTWYSKATWVRFNRQATDTFRPNRGLMLFDANATINWEGGQSVGDGVVAVLGDNDALLNKPKLFSNGTLNGLGTQQFNINDKADISFDKFSVIGNRFVDGRSDITVTDYTATNSLLEGGNNQTFVNYSGNVQYATWNRQEKTRTFENSEDGMTLPIQAFTSNVHQKGGQMTITKSGVLTVVDKDKTPISSAKVSLKTYDDGNRIAYPTEVTATDLEQARYTDQVAVANLTGSVNASGEFSFNQILKQMTQPASFTVVITNIVGTFVRGDTCTYTRRSGSNGSGVIVYFDANSNTLVVNPENNVSPSSGQTISTATASADFVSAAPNETNLDVRYTKGASDISPVVDCVSISYLQGVSTTELDYSGKGAFMGNVFKLPEPFISNQDEASVAAYTTLENNNKVYDALLLYLYNNWNQEDETICTFSGGYLDFGSNSVVLSGTQVATITENAGVYTLGVGTGRYEGNLRTTGTITLVGGAVSNGLIDQSGIITYPDRLITLTGLVSGSRVYVFDTTNNVELFNEVSLGTEFSGYASSDGTDANLLVRVRNASSSPQYKPVATTAVLTATGVNISINQVIDR